MRRRQPSRERRLRAMLEHLLGVYEESLLNVGKPECLFAETEIFNEGWLLRSVLREWKTGLASSEMPFLPFPANARVYSEGQLFTPFKVRPRSERVGEPKGETNTRIDGIVGYFSIAEGTKSGIELDRRCPYIAVFEAKLYSPIGKGTKNAPGYDQVSRTAACLIHALLGAEPREAFEAHIVVLYPKDNLAIRPEEFDKVQIREQIRKRLTEYSEAGRSTPELQRFEDRWEWAFERLPEPHFSTWEDVLEEIGDGELDRFYDLCKRFSGPPAHP
jgi:hypothetical protein